MTTTPSNAVHLKSLLKSSPVLMPMLRKLWQYNDNTLVVVFDVKGNAASIDLAVTPATGIVAGSVLGKNPQMQRHLRNTLVGKARLVVDSSERHLLGTWSLDKPVTMVKELAAWIHWLQHDGTNTPNLYAPSLPLPSGHTSVYWWDKRSNFGDAVGPWLIGRMTGLTPTNARNAKIGNRPLLSVGSIIGMLERDAADIWGSGLIGPLEGPRLDKLSRFSDVKVHAVRGKVTRDELMAKLGWTVPEVYGDPALLLPRFLVPERHWPSEGKISLVPHYIHAKHFKAVSGSDLHVVDVRQGLETVVKEIASSRVCISTSLHGIIVAQAYNVPWIWLRIQDHTLGGDQFKFNDFFSTLDATAVASMEASAASVSSIDFTEAATRASLPRLDISLDALVAALPLPQSTAHPATWTPPALPSLSILRLTRFASRQKTRLRKAVVLVLQPRRGAAALARRLKSNIAVEESPAHAPNGIEQELSSVTRELRKQNQVLHEIHEAITTPERKRRLDTGDASKY